ncbi:MAG: hypothetical protein K8T89_07290 [Planctomycetes bacterium]|nr:hypothetical protein [Planctomycetota bacterium]
MSPALPIGITESAAPGLEMSSPDSDFIEVAMLLPRWQALALSTAARQRGMSAGQMLRRIIGATIGSEPPSVTS